MGTLYVVAADANIQVRGGRLVVTRDGVVTATAALDRLSEVVIVGRAGITVPALHGLLARDARLVLLTYAGKAIGRLAPPTGKNHPRRRLLYARAADPAFCLAVSRALVAAKVANSRALARRWARGLAAEGVGLAPSVVGDLDRFEAAAWAAADLATLRGTEGQAARLYYQALRARLRGRWDFPRRSRRPPADPMNSLLGIVYSLLTQACISALEVVGLDPYEGLFHADKYGRPALALDMMEPFRSYIGDSLALRLVNRRMLKPADFAEQDGGVVLRSAGWRVVLDQYAARMNEEVQVRDQGRRMTVREVVELQARRLVACLESGDGSDFRPFRVR